MHNADKVLLGTSLSSDKAVSQYAADPASFVAGVACRLKSDDTVSLTKADGGWLGVSLGKSLSDTSKLAILRMGEKVPVRAALKRSSGVITVSSYTALVSGTDDAVAVGATSFVAQAGAATLGQATFQAATSNEATAISLAAQINAHATASTLVKAVVSGAVVTLYAKVEGAGTGNDVGLTYTDNDTNVGIVLSGLSSNKLSGGTDDPADIDYAVLGAKVYFNDVDGKADVAGLGTISDAVYVSTGLIGIDESGAEVAALLVDMPGGL
jgi:hypothetical protein